MPKFVTPIIDEAGHTVFGVDWESLVYIHAGAPGSSYVAPLWFDSTASTGGLYCWTGSAYSKIGLAENAAALVTAYNLFR